MNFPTEIWENWEGPFRSAGDASDRTQADDWVREGPRIESHVRSASLSFVVRSVWLARMNALMRIAWLLALGSGVVATGGAADNKGAGPKDFFVYFGTYTKGKSEGIYRARLEIETGRMAD